jgi:hypothetical protein
MTHIKCGFMLCILYVRNGERYGGLRIRAGEHRRPILVRSIGRVKSSKMREDISGENQWCPVRPQTASATDGFPQRSTRYLMACKSTAGSVVGIQGKVSPTPRVGLYCYWDFRLYCNTVSNLSVYFRNARHRDCRHDCIRNRVIDLVRLSLHCQVECGIS